MIDSIEISNYRNLKHLKLDSLSNVNLITGKNNTGKSTLLEAIAIYASKCNITFLNKILKERGEMSLNIANNQNEVEANLKIISSFFTNRIVGFEAKDAVKIQCNSQTIDNFVSMRYVNYYEDVIKENGSVNKVKRINESVDNSNMNENSIGLELRFNDDYSILPIERVLTTFNLRTTLTKNNFQLILGRNIDNDDNGKLWDAIALTKKEQYVIDALRIIEPAVEGITFINESLRERVAIIKLKDSASVVPLLSMGDGINHILTIILALVNSEGSFLLIDELENGLHYSTLKQLWEIIFTLADKLNIQVFATTHSNDCIFGFEQILNSDGNNTKGKLIRLDNINGVIKETDFDGEELRIAYNRDIEIR